MNTDLKPCPFCGENDLHLHERPSNDKTITWYHLHHGPTTTCSISMMDSDKATLLERWNKRSVGNQEDGMIDGISQETKERLLEDFKNYMIKEEEVILGPIEDYIENYLSSNCD